MAFNSHKDETGNYSIACDNYLIPLKIHRNSTAINSTLISKAYSNFLLESFFLLYHNLENIKVYQPYHSLVAEKYG